MNIFFKFLTALVTTALLSACPSSSGDSTSTTTYNQIFGLAVEPDGSLLYIANTGRSTIQSLDISNNDFTKSAQIIAGTDNVSGSTNATTGTSARFGSPFGLLLDGTTLYVTEYSNNKIRTLFTNTKEVRDHSASQTFSTPMAIAQFGTNIYVAVTGSHIVSLISSNNNNFTSPWAGTGLSTPFTNAAKLNSTFNGPRGITTDAAGNVYVSDSLNHVIRRIGIDSQVSTIAGSVTADLTGGYTNSTTGTNAKFNLPTTMVFSNLGADAPNGALYVTDTLNHAIRRISLTAPYAVTTYAGFGENGAADTALTATSGNTDTTDRTLARFYLPWGLAIDNAQNLYVGDQGGTKVKRITAAQVKTYTTTF